MFDENENFAWFDKNYFILIINSFNVIKYSQQASLLQQGTEFPTKEANIWRVQDFKTYSPISIRTVVHD